MYIDLFRCTGASFALMLWLSLDHSWREVGPAIQSTHVAVVIVVDIALAVAMFVLVVSTFKTVVVDLSSSLSALPPLLLSFLTDISLLADAFNPTLRSSGHDPSDLAASCGKVPPRHHRV